VNPDDISESKVRSTMSHIWDFRHGKMAKDESGYIMIMSLFVLVIASAIGVGLVVVGINEFNLSLRTKLMDQAYAIAEAGINRATVQMQLDETLCSSCGANNFYMVSGNTPQWPAGDINGKTESFGGGSYTVTLWQSERTSPTNERILATHKVIRSTGTVTQGGTTAERTIEARVVTGPINTEYDASFDYLIYNGYSEEGGNGTWPGNRYWTGTWTFDGYTPDQGRYPKGAIYTKGNINIPVSLAATANIYGNVVATNSVAFSNTVNVGNINIRKGNVVAGLNRDEVGSNSININVGFSVGGLRIYADGAAGKGHLVAYKDVTFNSFGSANFSNTLLLGVNQSGVLDGGIKAGQDVSISGSVGIGQSTLVGNIWSGRKTNVNSSIGSIRTASINAGQHTNGDGVVLTTTLGSIDTGAITSRGKVSANATAAYVNTGDIYAGNNVIGEGGGGTGVDWQILFAYSNVGNVRSTGAVYWNWIPLITWINHGSVTTPYTPKPTAPTVDVLSEAGLTKPVDLVEPNWSYFQAQAAQDDLVNGPNIKKCPNCRRAVEGDGDLPPNFPSNCPTCGASLAAVSPGPAHIIWDRAAAEPVGTGGDYGDANDGYIDIHWDDTLPYSSNETVYNGDTSKTIRIIKLNWQNLSQQFEGTIAGRGDVLLNASDTNWFINTSNKLNICAGRDIIRQANGVTLFERSDSHFHFWAKRNISLNDLTFSIVGGNTLYGSFTAGNKFTFTDMSFITNLTFKWSRWPLPAQAWTEPVRILNWKEI
jgi:hypothetical protein